LLLEVLSDWQVSVPEMGTVAARRIPLVFLTSNGTRDLSEALKRRCLFLHLDYPSVEREREIVLARVPELPSHLAAEVARVVRSLRLLDLRKPPSVSETLDWARTLVVFGVSELDASVTESTLHVLLKHRADIATAARELKNAG
jgi:MoxR-like ATPase